MRIRNRIHLKKYYVKITVIYLIPIILFSTYLSGLLYFINDMGMSIYLSDTDPERDGFVPLNDMDLNDLYDMAKIYSIREDLYHTPINLSQSVTFYGDTDNVYYYHSTDNAGLFTGYALASESLRYYNLPNGTPEKEQSLNLTKKLVSGMARLIEIPNGGLGPEYPGQTLARFYAAPEWKDDGNFSWIFEDHFKHFNGTGQYSQWRVRLYTSKDEIGGYLLGIASALKFVDDPWVQNIIKLIVGQMANGFLSSYWQEIHGDGTPCGAILQPPTEAQWKMLLMKMATICYPDNQKYKQLYQYYSTKEIGILGACSTSYTDSVSNYYGLPFGHNVIFGLIILEEDPHLRDIYIRNYEKSYFAFKGHRNAYFNAIYLALAKLRTTIPKFNITKIRWDVLDQLWRFKTAGLCPFDDSYGNANISKSRLDFALSDPTWLDLDPSYQKWANSPLKPLFTFLWGGEDSMMPNLMNYRFKRPATSDMFSIGSFIWGDNPFEEFGGNQRRSPYFTSEVPGVSFSLPYWIMRVYGYL